MYVGIPTCFKNSSSFQFQVPLFFLLSGFCLAIANDKVISHQTFLKKRMFRIYPTYAITFLLAVPFKAALQQPFKSITTLSMMHSWFNWGKTTSKPFYSFNGFHESWTISTLFFFYLTFPTLFKICYKRTNRTLSGIIVISFLCKVRH